MSKQEEINKRFDELWNKHCKPNGYCVISPNLFQKDIKKIIKSEISLALAEREEQIFSRLKELGCGDAVNVIEMELHYKPKQK